MMEDFNITILDQSPEVIEQFLKETGKTREEVEQMVARSEESWERTKGEPLKGTNPDLEDKFTFVPAYDVVKPKDKPRRG
ncbi:hypothetical protein IT774_05070 [Salinimonas marina]|uniref:Uncharacterized protein n=1 Tax=Salinimonas marina TaxID=2785918 RepID=A0A7S9HDT8_9ALTE|nr:hypothetical protein [Salinimonas marina]QPG06545.1 hypothetical protein IT774_05070 [Salinimonas marina]